LCEAENRLLAVHRLLRVLPMKSAYQSRIGERLYDSGLGLGRFRIRDVRFRRVRSYD